MRKTCKGCYHRRSISTFGTISVCNYCIDMDELRGCPASECTHYITEKEFEKMRGQRISAETKEMVIQAAQKGVPYKIISEKLGVSNQSVSRLAVEAGIRRGPVKIKDSPEAPTPMENASEDITDSGSSADTNIIPDVPEVVKPDALLNSAIDDAVLDRIEKLGLRIDEIMKERRALEIERNTLIEYHEKFMEAQNNGT